VIKLKSIWVPDRELREPLRQYYEVGIMPKGFLLAMLSGNVAEAARIRKQDSYPRVGDWAIWLEENLPADCFGSMDKVRAWCARRLESNPELRAVTEIDDEIIRHEELIARLRERRAKAVGEVKITCESNNHGKGCGQSFPIKDITYIATHWYTSPSGCTGGDYWNEGEGEFVCPSCGHQNRMYDREHYQAMKRQFKNVVDRHDRN